jgi:hypothetical protein
VDKEIKDLMETVKIVDGKIELLPQMLDWLGSEDELVVLIQGDTLILKKLRLPKLSEIAERAPGEKEMSMTEIAAEVHAYRKEK